jgi:hypothetical protein
MSLSGKSATLFMSRQNCPDTIFSASQSLMQRHAGSAWVGKDRVATVAYQSLDQNIGSGNRFGTR